MIHISIHIFVPILKYVYCTIDLALDMIQANWVLYKTYVDWVWDTKLKD